MKIVNWVLLGALALLSLAAGGAKLAQVPEEAAFFNAVGLDTGWMIALGAIQVIGAIAIAVLKTRVLGLAAVALGFLASSAMIFATGNMQFGVISLLPVAACLGLIWQTKKSATLSA